MGVVLEDSSHTEKLGIHIEADKVRVDTNSVNVTSFKMLKHNIVAKLPFSVTSEWIVINDQSFVLDM